MFPATDSLQGILRAVTSGRGVASVVVRDAAGGQSGAWIPTAAQEPAFLVYSITKTFTATVVLKLCEAGALTLDDRLATWFPAVPMAERISLRQLLNHTAGVPDYGGLPVYHESVRSSPSVPWSFERFATETFAKGLLFAPGDGWAYSNPGYMLVKRVLELVTNRSYANLICDMAQSLDLQRTFVAESIADLATLAEGTSPLLATDGEQHDCRHRYHPGWVSHGVVASTASDCARFIDALFTGRIVSTHSVDQMCRLVDLSDELASPGAFPLRPQQPGYGLGLMGDPSSPWGRLFGHSGGGPCYSASAFHAFDLDAGLSVAAMSAIEQINAERIVAAVLDACAASR